MAKQKKPVKGKQSRSSKKTEQRSVELYTSAYAGPIPSPEDFREYEDVLTGAADRILSMAEREQDDRHESNRMQIRYYYLARIFGQSLFGLVCLAAILAGAHLISSGHDISGLISLISGLSILGGSFLYTKHKGKDKE